MKSVKKLKIVSKREAGPLKLVLISGYSYNLACFTRVLPW